MDTGCENGNAVASAAQERLASTVPCAQQSACSANVTSSCASTFGSGRKKKSAPSLVLNIVVTVDMSPYQNISENDTAAWTQYNNLVTTVNQSLSISSDPSLLTLNVGGQVIQPVAEQANSTIILRCQPGSVFLRANCADCPPGTRESEGRCEICPIGQYQDLSGATHCVTCPDGLTTELAGSSDVSLCSDLVTDVVVSTLPPVYTGETGESGVPLVIILPVVLVAVFIFVVALIVYKCHKCHKNHKRSCEPSEARFPRHGLTREHSVKEITTVNKEASSVSARDIILVPAAIPPPSHLTLYPKVWPGEDKVSTLHANYQSIDNSCLNVSRECSWLPNAERTKAWQ